MDNAARDIARAPMPTAKTVATRKNLLFQGWRFVVLNMRMLKMILKGHH
ncbi:MAG: hypothetical protein Q8K86_09325 [Candidatus Nanopelagicaceae bacterium]|nr:hypothetical protein [Candidatus Nanopelagicaceae bacterium]